MAASFPPLPAAPLAWIGIVPLIRALEGRSPRQALRIGFMFGVVYHVLGLYWIAFHTQLPLYTSIPGWISAALIVSLYSAIPPFVSRYASRWIGNWWTWTLPFTWVSAEYLRFLTEIAFPWSTIGHSQARLLGIIQQADIWGVIGVSFWLVVMNVLAYHAYRFMYIEQRKSWRYAAIFALTLMATITYGSYRLAETPQQPVAVRAGIVQPNIDMDAKWGDRGLERSREIYLTQTLDIDSNAVDLVIWPETALPDYMVYAPAGSLSTRIINRRYRQLFRGITDHLGTPLVFGSPVYDYGIESAFNSGVVVMPESLTVQTYDKRLLVPFGEHVPYSRIFGFLDRLNLGIASWSVGGSADLLHSNGVSYGMVICFESVFPSVMRDYTRRGADFSVVITNDAWFGRSSLIYQHADFAAFRAIETRTWIARAANTGISAIYDPWGRMTIKAPAFKRQTIIGSVGYRERPTLYLLLGDWIAWVSIVATGVFVVGAWRVTRRDRKRVP